MLRQKIRLPDVDPAIAHAEVTAIAPLSAPLKAAGFSIAAIVLFIVLNAGWSQLSTHGRAKPVEISAANADVDHHAAVPGPIFE
jgi:hypothetical protein